MPANPLNPYTCDIQGDLSRADVAALVTLCRGCDVAEFGVGGSTLLLARVAETLRCIDTDGLWRDRVNRRLAEMDGLRCRPEITLVEKTRDPAGVAGLGGSCDVFFDDGWGEMRAPLLLEFWPYVRKCAILHDTRLTYAANAVVRFLNRWEPAPEGGVAVNHFLATLERIDWNYMESNCAVLWKRNAALHWENWNQTEAANHRLGWCP